MFQGESLEQNAVGKHPGLRLSTQESAILIRWVRETGGDIDIPMTSLGIGKSTVWRGPAPSPAATFSLSVPFLARLFRGRSTISRSVGGLLASNIHG